MESKTLGLAEAAKLCRVSTETVRRWIEREGLPIDVPGEDARLSKTSLGVFLTSHGIWTPPELAPKLGPCVLVVDDEVDMRGLVSRVVLRLAPDARIHEASDGFEAGQKIMALEPEVIVLDLHLPGLEGVKVCHNIRACAGFKKTRVLAISGDKDPALRETVLKEGADGFLHKPFYPRDLEVLLEPFLAAR